jgi:hypothetical protein
VIHGAWMHVQVYGQAVTGTGYIAVMLGRWDMCDHKALVCLCVYTCMLAMSLYIYIYIYIHMYIYTQRQMYACVFMCVCVYLNCQDRRSIICVERFAFVIDFPSMLTLWGALVCWQIRWCAGVAWARHRAPQTVSFWCVCVCVCVCVCFREHMFVCWWVCMCVKEKRERERV